MNELLLVCGPITVSIHMGIEECWNVFNWMILNKVSVYIIFAIFLKSSVLNYSIAQSNKCVQNKLNKYTYFISGELGIKSIGADKTNFTQDLDKIRSNLLSFTYCILIFLRFCRKLSTTFSSGLGSLYLMWLDNIARCCSVSSIYGFMFNYKCIYEFILHFALFFNNLRALFRLIVQRG